MSAQPVTDIETLYRPTHDEASRHRFVGALKRFAKRNLVQQT